MNHPLEKEPGISIVTLNNERDIQRHNLDAVAQQLFGGDVHRLFPIFMVFYHGALCGYFQAVEQIVVYPAIHPGALNPGVLKGRKFFRVARDLIREFKRMTGNPIYMLCPKVNELTERQLKLMRLKAIAEKPFIYSED